MSNKQTERFLETALEAEQENNSLPDMPEEMKIKVKKMLYVYGEVFLRIVDGKYELVDPRSIWIEENPNIHPS